MPTDANAFQPALARAWLTRPEVLFLDEPTSALDPAAIRAVEAAVLDFHARGARIVMTTHDPNQGSGCSSPATRRCSTSTAAS
ncbi:ABC transporter ATP-binding protein [Halomonas sp. BM-2019]|uniref:ATP-binding cassette domain-containing protein n=1 Tax=Halomonas sp. BM-2019 TaxID=2811227 RepID=UPI001B3C22D2|nr:MAG: AAA family ATPase [Halomonas sp. BM-2019]